MQTFKKLGCKMERNTHGSWLVSGKDLYYESQSGDANKGAVMAEALQSWHTDGKVAFVKGTGWVRK
jgi:hypothetical protein